MGRDIPVLIAGAGIAALTAALALAHRGITVQIFEQAARLDPVGAGLQLSPNATRLLNQLGVLERLRAQSVAPRAIALRDGRTLREIASVPLGAFAVSQWGAPYLTAHRADLQAALLAAVLDRPLIGLENGVALSDLAFTGGEVIATLERGGESRERSTPLAIVAAGVWSPLRQSVFAGLPSRFAGSIAWRATVDADLVSPEVTPADAVSAILMPGVHLVAYPIRAGKAVNLVAFTPGTEPRHGWNLGAEKDLLERAFSASAKPLRDLLASISGWTTWPVYVAPSAGAWIDPRGAALIGDAAHAMTPFAAQGAAMAIEDAWVLAAQLDATPDDVAGALRRYEVLRRGRIKRVAARGAFNRLAWHAAGPVATARNLVLRARSPARLAADLDWLYGWQPD